MQTIRLILPPKSTAPLPPHQPVRLTLPPRVPTVRPGCEVRPRVDGWNDKRGTVASEIRPGLWAVTFPGISGEVDFATADLTPLN